MKDSHQEQSCNYVRTLNCRGKLINLETPKIMGILNITPDSFSDGGKFNTENAALQHTQKMIEDGAEIIDVGAQSTRPGAEKLSAEQEISRLSNILPQIRKNYPEILISLDTFYAETVRFGYNEGVDIVNDISGAMFDGKMVQTVAETGLPYILMHVNSSYQDMHHTLIDRDIILELNYYFSEKTAALHQAGINDIIIDPGFGFGKTVEQQYQIISELHHLTFGKYPVLAGISRKSFIYKPLEKSPLEINAETQTLHLELLRRGAAILRVHDVASASETVKRWKEEQKITG